MPYNVLTLSLHSLDLYNFSFPSQAYHNGKSYGYAELTVFNETHTLWEWVPDSQRLGVEPADTVWLINKIDVNHTVVPSANDPANGVVIAGSICGGVVVLTALGYFIMKRQATVSIGRDTPLLPNQFRFIRISSFITCVRIYNIVQQFKLFCFFLSLYNESISIILYTYIQKNNTTSLLLPKTPYLSRLRTFASSSLIYIPVRLTL